MAVFLEFPFPPPFLFCADGVRSIYKLCVLNFTDRAWMRVAALEAWGTKYNTHFLVVLFFPSLDAD